MESIEFQAHITTEKLTDTNKYIQLCENNKVKPVLIKLDSGDYYDQPMYTQNFVAQNLKQALQEVEKTKIIFEQNGFKTVRTKLEIPPNSIMEFFHASYGSKLEDFVQVMHNCYLECHIKVKYDDLNILKQISNKVDFYLSQNDIELGYRFLSKRLYNTQNLDSISQVLLYNLFDIENLHSYLKQHNIEIVKEKFEYCVYDSRITLDKNWGQDR
ncbi:MAG: hypothetical protein ATN35_05275 [Epulopiscium sp. Nele67-Bin004]|nr:MAG: hypothetical protein ATN35_05275 [Epulopiscium sp. Nele67-Bin004]